MADSGVTTYYLKDTRIYAIEAESKDEALAIFEDDGPEVGCGVQLVDVRDAEFVWDTDNQHEGSCPCGS